MKGEGKATGAGISGSADQEITGILSPDLMSRRFLFLPKFMNLMLPAFSEVTSKLVRVIPKFFSIFPLNAAWKIRRDENEILKSKEVGIKYWRNVSGRAAFFCWEKRSWK